MRAVVTGASGYLGSELVRGLLASGDEVVAGSRKPVPELAALGARPVELDLSDRDALREAFRGAEVVYHAAAKVGVTGSRADFVASNVAGTENVIAACEARRVPRLVFTSSPSVVFDGGDHVMASNDLPYPTRYASEYPRTKALAERAVLAANGRWGLSTCALRPHLIVGVRDPHLVPRIVQRARAGKLVRVGDGRNEVTLCPVEDAVHAHLLAGRALAPGVPHAGKAYFIGDARPVVLWAWIEGLLAALGIEAPRRRLSKRAAYAVGAACEVAWRILRRDGEPPLTRFVALQLATSHSYDMKPASRDFGYQPVVSTEAATERIVAALHGR